jgi:hypothetical protein
MLSTVDLLLFSRWDHQAKKWASATAITANPFCADNMAHHAKPHC